MKYDCHVQVFDPRRWAAADRTAAGVCASSNELIRFLDREGMRGAVAVQPLAYGGAHGCLVDALSKIGDRTCGVASVSRHSLPEEIEMLDRLGIRGTRLELHGNGLLQMLDEVCVLHERLPSQWHIELIGEWRYVAKMSHSLVRFGRNFVGLCMESRQRPPELADLRKVIWWMGMGNFYLKLVLPNDDAEQNLNGFRRTLFDLSTDVSDRLLWGSGWPHVSPRKARQMHTGLPRGTPGFLLELEESLDLNAQALYGFAG